MYWIQGWRVETQAWQCLFSTFAFICVKAFEMILIHNYHALGENELVSLYNLHNSG